MPKLENPKHERFAQLLAKGQSQLKAYVKAGYEYNLGNPNHLAKEKHIVARVQELQEYHQRRAAVSVEMVATEVKKIAATATRESDRLKAWELLSKLFGYFEHTRKVEVKHSGEVKHIELDGLSEDKFSALRDAAHAARLELEAKNKRSD